jgi:hypothetical protein
MLFQSINAVLLFSTGKYLITGSSIFTPVRIRMASVMTLETDPI